MKILVINGSPKGENSVTLQTVRFLELKFPAHSFRVLHVGQKIKQLEKDFSEAKAALEEAEVLLFSYPVYTFIAPYQLHRFVELVKESGVELAGRYATQLSTSKHFYDVTAHRYIQDNCADLGLKYIRGLSADMDDLTTEQGRREAVDFLNFLEWSVREDIYEPVSVQHCMHAPKAVEVPACRENQIGDVVIITDCREEDTQLAAMISRFRAVSGRKTRIFNLWDFPFRGGCLGCFNCAVSGKCIYTDRFDDCLRKELQTAQAMVYAFTVKDHSMGARFKLYDDRQFCNGHRTVTMGMPVGYLVSGCYSKEDNLRMIVEGRAQVGHNYLAGVATDEVDPDTAIDAMAKKLDYALENAYVPPQNFFGIGGMKIFRDLIWLMQGMMRADHKFYKAHGQYDFPQKQRGKMLAMYLVGAMLANPKLKAKAGSAMTDGMLMPYKKVLDQARKECHKED